MKNKVLSVLIYILIFAILIVSGIFVYQAHLFKRYAITFELNGVESIDNTVTECTMSLKGCYVILPKATRDNGVVLGYNLNPDYEIARYKEGDIVYLQEDTTLYVISYAIRKVTIEKNNVDYLEKNTVSCNAYNKNKGCTVQMPNFNKLGYKNAGYSTQKNSTDKTAGTYFPNEEYVISKDLKLYPKYSNDRRGETRTYSTSQIYQIKGTFVESQKNTPQSTNALYKGYLDEISKQAPYLFAGSKITLLEKSTFSSSRYF